MTVSNIKNIINKSLINLATAHLATMVFALCLLSACNKSSNSSPHAAPPNGQIEFIEIIEDSADLLRKISVSGKLPSEGEDHKTLVFSDYYEMPNAVCDYTVTEKIVVTHKTETTIEQTLDRDFLKDSENSSDCPEKNPNYSEHNVSTMDVSQFIQLKMETIKKYLDPANNPNNSWLQSLKITSSNEINYRGLRTQVVEMEGISKKGTKYIYTQYVALDSIFLGRFEYNLRRVENRTTTDYQILSDFSLK
jgi:hypothetical protein